MQASSLLFTYKRACQLFKPGVSRHKIYYTFGYLQALFLVFAAIIIKKRFFFAKLFFISCKRFFWRKKTKLGWRKFCSFCRDRRRLQSWYVKKDGEDSLKFGWRVLQKYFCMMNNIFGAQCVSAIFHLRINRNLLWNAVWTFDKYLKCALF